MCYKQEAAYQEDYKGYSIRIEYDNDGLNSPREWDNLGTMICWHRRDNYGDEHSYDNPHDMFYDLARKIVGCDKIESWGDLSKEDYNARLMRVVNANYVMLPIFGYDHGGMTISAGRGYPFNDPWDSGQLGFIYISRARIKEEMCRVLPLRKGEKNPRLAPIKHITKKILARAENALRGEIQTYNDYLTGNVYGFIIEKDGEMIESVWGFYPDHENEIDGHKFHGPKYRADYDYCLQEARSIVDYRIQEDAEKYECLETENMEFAI